MRRKSLSPVRNRIKIEELKSQIQDDDEGETRMNNPFRLKPLSLNEDTFEMYDE